MVRRNWWIQLCGWPSRTVYEFVTLGAVEDRKGETKLVYIIEGRDDIGGMT